MSNENKADYNFEDEYYLLYPSDITAYPLIYEDCHGGSACSYKNNQPCSKVPDCPAYYMKKGVIKKPRPFVMDFLTAITGKPVIYADCYMPFSLSKSSFAVSPKLYAVLSGLNIEGVQFIPVTLLENGEVKYADFRYAHAYNFLPVLSEENSRYQESSNGNKIRNNILQIKFNSARMKKINLENRLLFRLPLGRSYFIFHVSVAEKITAINPAGVQFIKISEMNLPDTGGFLI